MKTRDRVAFLQNELEHTRAMLRESQARYEAIRAAVNETLFDWNMDADSITFSRPILGLSSIALDAPLPASKWKALTHPEDRKRFDEALAKHIDGSSPFFRCEIRVQNDDNGYHWVQCHGQSYTNSSTGRRWLSGSLTDLVQNGLLDPLTGLANRRLITDRLQLALERSGRQYGTTTALLFMDLNRFKNINDSLGHHIGDQLLIEFARRLQFCVRSGDTAARLGGDEFVVILENVDRIEGVMSIVKRIERYTASVYNLAGNTVASSTSIGIVLDIHRYGSVDAILRDADIAMYEAKRKTLPYIVFDEAMHEKVLARHEVENELRAGIEQNEFVLEFQPIVSLRTGKVKFLEALVRWQHPHRGLLGPSEFIEVAEDTGLIVPLGEWVLYKTCVQLKLWQENGSRAVPAGVNISGKQLAQPGIVQTIQAILSETGLDPGWLKLEITEGALINDVDDASKKLKALKALGLSIALDDFGTGYSSMSYLRDFPFDHVKIDRSFVRNLNKDPKCYQIIRTIAEMVTGLKMSVITEGIETADQLVAIQQLPCEFGQGYLFSRPLTVDQFNVFTSPSLQFTDCALSG